LRVLPACYGKYKDQVEQVDTIFGGMYWKHRIFSVEQNEITKLQKANDMHRLFFMTLSGGFLIYIFMVAVLMRRFFLPERIKQLSP
jgi:hypothetical protein